MLKKIKLVWVICIIILIVSISGCTSSSDAKNPVNGKYNTIVYNDSSEVVWDNDTCPLCGELDAEAQTETEHLIFNKCTKCGYNFISVKKY